MTKITVETTIAAPLPLVWDCWTTPADIMAWNAASDDWHTTASTVDLRAGGAFSSRMEAKDGSMGFDFGGTYTVVDPHKRIVASFGDRTMEVTFRDTGAGIHIVETFDAEDQNPVDMQRAGWQSILDNFARHVMARHAKG
jgi:uncharacterized protein YndB with AHSA1/START domain